MSFSQILLLGPEFAFAQAMVIHSPKIPNLEVVSFINEDLLLPQAITDRIRKLYAVRQDNQVSYVSKLSAPKKTMRGGSLVDSSYTASTERTQYYLVDDCVVVSTEKKLDKSRKGEVNHDETIKMELRVTTSFDDMLQGWSGSLLPIKTVAMRWFESAYLKLSAFMMGTGAASTVLYLAAVTVLAKAVLVSIIGLQILAAYRIYQVGCVKEKVQDWNNLGEFAGQMRRWSYQYPSLAQTNPFLLSQERIGLAH